MKVQLEDREIAYARGKTAGHTVYDDDMNLIIRSGDNISDDVIDHARSVGKLHYLMLAAAASVVQAGGEQARERLQEFRDVMEGHEADFVRNKPVGRDVMDMQGNVLLHEGDIVTDDVIDQMETEGMLQELVLAVGAPGIHA